jgi:transcriptional regulator with XRE-family HTH domain
MDIGTRLYSWRSHLGLTLKAVSRRAGVGHAMLSKMEIGHSNVRLAKLEAIVTRGLKMSMVKFFGKPPRQRRRPGKLMVRGYQRPVKVAHVTTCASGAAAHTPPTVADVAAAAAHGELIPPPAHEAAHEAAHGELGGEG